MSNVSDRAFGRLPHTHQQLTRGVIGLFVGGTVAILTGLLVSLLDAPVWVDVGIGAVTFVSLAVAVLAPVWYWLVEPYVTDAGDS